MTIEFRCSACDQMLRVPDSAAGKQARCPKCQAMMSIPAAAAQPPAGFSAPLPSLSQPAHAPAEPLTRPASPAPLPQQPAFSPFQPGAKTDLEQQLDFLKAGMSPSAPAEPSPNPFADGGRLAKDYSPSSTTALPGGVAGELNPYASPPMPGVSAYAPQFDLSGAAPGLPWEAKGQSVGTWIETSGMIISDSSAAFRRMRHEGSIVAALIYWVIGSFIGAVGAIFWQLLVTGIEAMGNQGNMGALLVGMLIGGIVGLGIGLVFGLVVLVLQSALLHGILHLLGGANRGYETTLRVTAYAQGSIAWLQIVPVVGGCIILVLILVTMINGIASAHQTTSGKAAGAVISMIALMVGFIVAMIAGVVALGISLQNF